MVDCADLLAFAMPKNLKLNPYFSIALPIMNGVYSRTVSEDCQCQKLESRGLALQGDVKNRKHMGQLESRPIRKGE